MFPLAKGSARTRLTLERLSQDQFERLQRSGSLIVDTRRRRTAFFNGKFLAAQDLIRDQNYLLTRQADLNRSFGTGVVHGLMVGSGSTANSIRIQAGHGFTPSGEQVALLANLELSLSNIPQTQELNAYFGLARVPNEPPRVRTGLFIVALRAVEFTATPTAAYPTSLEGRRTVQDGEIIEATAITLIPYEHRGGRDTDLNRRRSDLARTVFVDSELDGMPIDALPLAMVNLRLASVEWIDNWLVRREAGSQVEDVLGLGFVPRAVREAQFLQYRDHLADLLAQNVRGQGGRFTASAYFSALPPAGPMPVSGISIADFSQSFFPSEMEVDLSIIPQDELMSLVEESLALPPIDLEASADEIDATSVLILIPVTRAQLRTAANALDSLMLTLRPTAPGLVAKRKPLESLFAMRRFPLSLTPTLATVDGATAMTRAAWQALISRTPLLYYVRRRNLHYRSEVVGVSAPVFTEDDETSSAAEIEAAASDLRLVTIFNTVRNAASDRSMAEIFNLLSSQRVLESPLLFAGVMRELEAAAIENDNRLTRATVLTIAERYNRPQMGEGIQALVEAFPDLADNQNVRRVITQARIVPEIDLLALRATRPTVISPVISSATLPTLGPASIISASSILASQPVLRPDIVRPELVQPGIVRPDIIRPGIIRPDIRPSVLKLTLPILGNRLLELAAAGDPDALREFVLEQVELLR